MPTSTQGTQAWDRYAYVNGNPVRYGDPSGHQACAEISGNGGCYSEKDIANGRREADNKQGDSKPVCMDPNAANYRAVGYCVAKQTPGLVNYPPNDPYEGLPEIPLAEIVAFWNYFASYLNDINLMYYAYQLSSKGGWRAVSYALPTGGIEALVAALAQGYKDSWYQSLSPVQRVARIGVVGLEAYAIDGAATLSGGAGGVVGAFVGGPPGAAVGYGAFALVVSSGGNKFVANTLNPWLFPTSGLGIWP